VLVLVLVFVVLSWLLAGLTGHATAAEKEGQYTPRHADGEIPRTEELGPPPRWQDSVGEDSSGATHRQPLPSSGLVVNPRDRADSVRFYKEVYLASRGVASGWTGAISGCVTGTLSAGYIEAVRLRILYFRAMVGLGGDIVFDPELDAKCQEAALMMSANDDLNHNPPSNWQCHTQAGAEAASRSNLALGIAGPGAVDLYLEDPGEANYFVGHRRWLLYPPQSRMGLGDVTPKANYRHAAVLWVASPTFLRQPLPEWVAWPPHGYVPWQLVYPRWSFSCPKADFSNADVILTRNGAFVGLSVSTPGPPGFGDNTLVWIPAELPSAPPTKDVRYEVTIRNVRLEGVIRNFEYVVVVMDPDRQLSAPVLDPTPTPAPTPPPAVQAVINAVAGRSVPSADDDWNGDGAVDAADALRAGGP
jgi:hypothetical protein